MIFTLFYFEEQHKSESEDLLTLRPRRGLILIILNVSLSTSVLRVRVL